ncbi:hypothetical protein [Moraxella sp.]|uniref:hypothetical protein n=1 Tax=Moraxella sp. TaxID=479 RepID=UPI0026DACA6D|nr:hypothetical protein [Moraxella sp.]MDO4894134.1 hypothetical protein [Moraxella sp.]
MKKWYLMLFTGCLLTACGQSQESQANTTTTQKVTSLPDKFIEQQTSGQITQPVVQRPPVKILSVVDSLAAEDIFDVIYQNQYFEYYPNADEIDEYELAGVVTMGVDDGQNRYLAVFREILPLTNAQGEERYLAMIERLPIEQSEETGEWQLAMSVHANTAGMDFVLLKALSHGSFGILARQGYQEVAGSYGRAALLSHAARQDWQLIGKNRMGMIYEWGYTGTGITENYFRVIAVSDDQIEDLGITTNAGRSGIVYAPDSNQEFEFDSAGVIEQIDDSNPNQDYYPITVRVQGSDVEYQDEQPHLIEVDDSTTHQFDGVGTEYQVIKTVKH